MGRNNEKTTESCKPTFQHPIMYANIYALRLCLFRGFLHLFCIHMELFYALFLSDTLFIVQTHLLVVCSTSSAPNNVRMLEQSEKHTFPTFIPFQILFSFILHSHGILLCFIFDRCIVYFGYMFFHVVWSSFRFLGFL